MPHEDWSVRATAVLSMHSEGTLKGADPAINIPEATGVSRSAHHPGHQALWKPGCSKFGKLPSNNRGSMWSALYSLAVCNSFSVPPSLSNHRLRMKSDFYHEDWLLNLLVCVGQ
eukprot:1157468-Pelagomonas_calceolata.AAC.1